MVVTTPEHISVSGLAIINALVRLDIYEPASRIDSLECLLIGTNSMELRDPHPLLVILLAATCDAISRRV
jgi:hypothetical protein